VEGIKTSGMSRVKNPIYQLIGQNIQKLRVIKGLSQEDLAIISGYCRASIVNFEKGKQKISIDALLIIAQALDVPINIFFTESSSSEVRYWKKEYLQNEQKYQITSVALI
jgi:transcriptional regulator with XRE-family HTH domain